MLVERGADVNGIVMGDETPLINAARRGQLDVVKYLVGRRRREPRSTSRFVRQARDSFAAERSEAPVPRPSLNISSRGRHASAHS